MYRLPSAPERTSPPAHRPATPSACHAAVFSTPATPRMAHQVRRWAAQLLEAWAVPADEAVTVLAELVANAAEHGGADMLVRLHHCGSTLAVEVIDSGSAHPLPDLTAPTADPLDENPRGRGLPIAAALCDHLLIERRCDDSTRALALLTANPAHALQPDLGVPEAPTTGGGALELALA